MTSRADRERHVAQMLASSRLEGLEPDDDHRKLLQAYIEGTASLDDLMNHARDYATAVQADAYRSRLADDGGTYYLLPRDQHLLPPYIPLREDEIGLVARQLKAAVEAEEKKKSLPTRKCLSWSMLSSLNCPAKTTRKANDGQAPNPAAHRCRATTTGTEGQRPKHTYG